MPLFKSLIHDFGRKEGKSGKKEEGDASEGARGTGQQKRLSQKNGRQKMRGPKSPFGRGWPLGKDKRKKEGKTTEVKTDAKILQPKEKKAKRKEKGVKQNASEVEVRCTRGRKRKTTRKEKHQRPYHLDESQRKTDQETRA